MPSFIHSFILAISIAPLQVLYYSEVLPTTVYDYGYCIGVSRQSAQATVGKGLAQGPYVAARAGVEPKTLRLKVIISTKAPPRPMPCILDTDIQFLLRQAFADDEASTRLLQILLFLLLSTASLMFIPCAVYVRSSFTLSIHFFGCLPLLLVPSTCPYSATTGNLFPSILVTCPNHLSLFLILSTNVTCCPSSFLVTSFRILSLLDLPTILRSQLISASNILLSSSILRHQH